LLHQHHVGHSERQRASRAALAYHASDGGNSQPRHQFQVARDRLDLPALLRANSGLTALRVDQRDYRQPKPLCQLIDARRLAIALGQRLAEIALDSLSRRAAPLMTHHGDRPASEIGEPRHDRSVVGEAPVAMYLDKVAHQQVDVIERLRPIGMPRQAYALDSARRLQPRRAGRRDINRAAFRAARLMSVGIAFQSASRLLIAKKRMSRTMQEHPERRAPGQATRSPARGETK